MSQVRRAVLLSSGERYIILALVIGQTAIVSRILTPTEIGISMVGVALTQVIDSLRDFGTTSYLIQQPTLTRDKGRTAFTVLLLLSAVFAAILLVSSGFWAVIYDEPGLVPYLSVLAASFIVAPFGTPLTALMRRDFHFASLTAVNVGTAAVFALALTTAAMMGGSYMSFAWAALASTVATACIAVMLRPDTWIFRPGLSDWRTALAFGGISGLTGVLNRAYDLLPIILLGRFFPMNAVGIYSRALTVSQMPDKLLLSSLSAVVLPAFAAESRSGRDLKEPYLTAIGLITVVQWPAAILLMLLAQPVTALLLGPQWSAAVPLIQILAAASMLSFPATLSYPVLLASGGLRDTLSSSLISLPLSALVVVAAAFWGPTAVAVSQLVTVPVQVLVVLAFIRRRTRFSAAEMGRAVWKSAAVTGFTAVPALLVILASGSWNSPSIWVAALALAVAGGGWIGAILLLDHPLAGHILALAGSFSRRGEQSPAAAPRIG